MLWTIAVIENNPREQAALSANLKGENHEKHSCAFYHFRVNGNRG